VDAEVSRHLFEKCITGLYESKLVILVTHQLQYLPHASDILLLKHGKIIARGDYSFFQKTRIDIEEILADADSKVEEKEGGDERMIPRKSISSESIPSDCLASKSHNEEFINSGIIEKK
jgi:ATP-binding cassette subfamily C (CFTR/MRP) protein 4